MRFVMPIHLKSLFTKYVSECLFVFFVEVVTDMPHYVDKSSWEGASNAGHCIV